MNTNFIKLCILIAGMASMLTVACACTNSSDNATPMKTGGSSTIILTSGNFTAGGKIPYLYTCDGMKFSPELSWTPGPPETKYYVLLMEDRDTPEKPYSHWVLYNIPASVTELHEGISHNGILKSGAIQGRNSVGKLGYFGPCLPDTGKHRYYFTIYAVDAYFPLPSAYRNQILEAMKGHILARGELMGTYGN
jgi:hypothetical protein